MDYDISSMYTTSYSTQSSPVSSLISLAFVVLSIIGMWKVFTKAGEKGWKALIPFYNTYILFKIAGKKFAKYLVLFIIFFIAYVVMMVGSVGVMVGSLGGSSSVTNGMGIATLISAIVMIVTGIWLIVIQAKMWAGLSRKFGHGNGFAAGLFFLSPIFLMILGFNGDTYQGESQE